MSTWNMEYRLGICAAPVAHLSYPEAQPAAGFSLLFAGGTKIAPAAAAALCSLS